MNIFKAMSGNIVKWWQFQVMPVFRLDNNRSRNQQLDKQSAEASEAKGQANSMISDRAMKAESELKNNTVMVGGEEAMAVLNRINQEKENARRREIEKARKEAEEKARIAAIMNANKVDVDSFIQTGKAARLQQDNDLERNQENLNQNSEKEEELRRAQEIYERLMREAAEDEAKKESEIEEAKRQAEERFG